MSKRLPRTRLNRSRPKTVADSIDDSHQDYATLRAVADALEDAAGGLSALGLLIGEIIRDSIDRVIQTPKTGRRLYDHLERTEKTYIGTCVELDLRSRLSLEEGRKMDLLVAGHETDVKFSSKFGGWMIPQEAYGKACLLITADDTLSTFYAGLIVAHVEYLRVGKNQDKKLGIRAEARENILWLCVDHAYPPNFWLSIAPDVIKRISSGRTGNERAAVFMREVLDTPFTRKIVADVGAEQEDFMRRFRADASTETSSRDVANREGIVLLHGKWKKTQALIQSLGLQAIPKDAFMAHRFTYKEAVIARQLGWDVTLPLQIPDEDKPASSRLF